MRGSRVALLLLLLPLFAGCDGISVPRSCTLIGCTHGLSVELIDLPDGPYTLEVLLPGGERHTFECGQASTCPTRVYFSTVTDEDVTLRLSTAAGTRTETQRAVYTSHRPNGRRCQPVCWQADLKMRALE